MKTIPVEIITEDEFTARLQAALVETTRNDLGDSPSIETLVDWFVGRDLRIDTEKLGETVERFWFMCAVPSGVFVQCDKDPEFGWFVTNTTAVCIKLPKV